MATPAQVVVANRTVGRAAALAERVGGTGVGLDGLAARWLGADVVFVSTAAALPVLEAELLGPAASARAAGSSGAALVVVDLGVPRNVDHGVAGLAGIELLDMDDLTEHAERAMAGRRAELSAAQEIVGQEVERYRAEERSRGRPRWSRPCGPASRSCAGTVSSNVTGVAWASSTKGSGRRWTRSCATCWPSCCTTRPWR